MPIPGSPYTSIPSGISQPAQTMDPGMVASMLGQPQQNPDVAAGLSNDLPNAPSKSPEQDLFQRVVTLLMDPVTKQLNVVGILLMAGMGLKEALEKSGKYGVAKPHRSNEELMAGGYNVGNPGQAALSSPEQLTRQISPPSPPQMTGF